jgi:hypothetical protein
MSKKCSEIVAGLQFCTTTPTIAVKSGKNILVEMSLANRTNEPVSILVGDLETFYDVKVTDSSGKKIRSFREIMKERVEKGEASDGEWFKLFKINSRARPIDIKPNGESPFELNLSQFYDLTRPDTYQVTIARKLKDKLGKDFLLSFGTVTIEVQGMK